MRAQDYEKLSQEDHIRTIPDTYIGSTKQVRRKARLLTQEGFKQEEILLPDGLENLFLEVLANAGDNVERTRKSREYKDKISVSMNENSILIQNAGEPIPVEIHPDYNLWVPELLFGTLLTSSNYSGERTGVGRNGYGTKLVNLYSSYFAVEIGDSRRKKLYKQEWRDRMRVRGEPEIEEYRGESFVKVLFTLDLAVFAYKVFPPEAYYLFAAHCADLSFSSRVEVIFNQNPFSFCNIEEYAALFRKEYLIYRNKDVELAILDSSSGLIVSFVNSKFTPLGGTHVEGVYRGLDPLLKDLSKEGGKITLRQLKPCLSFILSVKVVDPQWSGQMKSGLKHPEVEFKFPQTFLRKIANLEVIRSLCYKKDLKLFTATDGKKKKHVKVLNLQDANFSGTKQSGECSLYVIEGLSASSYAEIIRDNTKGKDYIGVYPLRGKLLNVTNAKSTKIADNKVIGKLKEVLGLREGLDYTDNQNYQTLRYGHLFILADADLDARHIIGLIINFFYCRYPSLLQKGFVKYLRTPILRVQKRGRKLNFFTEGEYALWQKDNPDYKTWETKYLKGLGSSSPQEVQEDSKSPRVVVCLYDDSTPQAMKLAFCKELSDMRKEWIEKFQEELGEVFSIEGVVEQPISEFINQEFIQYSLYNMARSIPRLLDGLKISQRKIIWGAMDQWKSWHNTGKKKSMKVKQLAGKISSVTAYKHGEDCLSKAITLMVQDFVGTNNLPYFVQDGLMGSRSVAGKNAADPRYAHTYPKDWWRFVYKKEDEPLYELLEDEGETVEPKFLLPILPMVLVNGSRGIGSGYSTFIPNYSPLEIIDWLQRRLRNIEREKINPYYEGFTGDIYLTNNGRSLLTQGKFKKEGEKVVVTEIPIGHSIQSLTDHLLTLVEKKSIKDFRDKSTTNIPYVEIFGYKSHGSPLKLLKLESSFGLTNMVLLDRDNRPRRYKDVEEILEEFYQERLIFYSQRKGKQLEASREKLAKLDDKIKLILLVVEGKIEVKQKSKEEVERELEKYDLSPRLLKEVNLYSLTKEEVERLRGEKEKMQEEYLTLERRAEEDIWDKELEELKNYLEK